jgi:alkanesulfonate monooxygenase SsuD/methylene tetrahydromethanopterin reductase-like flavin-dependent oxidoreductase (luciferase family)
VTDETLEFLARCFAADEVELHGQRFLFRPRPARPPIFVGGMGRHALARAARFGDGWMPMGAEPAKLEPRVRELRELFAAAGKGAPEIAALTSLRKPEPAEMVERAQALAAIGATRVVFAWRYADEAEFQGAAEILASDVRPRFRS